MAKHRTISPNSLTERDERVLSYCRQIGDALSLLISDPQGRRDFKDNYSKISLTRDAGAGRGGGKLQRDALCTRGKTDKTPLANRNLRWHPLILAADIPPYARPVKAISVRETATGERTLVFEVQLEDDNIRLFDAADVHNLPDVFVALPEQWQEINHILQNFTDEDWSNNRCAISAMEYCTWEDGFETYASLALATAVEVYDVDFASGMVAVTRVFSTVNAAEATKFPTHKFPTDKSDAVSCPLCKKPFTEGLSEFRYADRLITWQPTWSTSKRSEGEDSSLQIMHVAPLSETVTNHNASNVRFGHRWCNVAMTDHSMAETLAFFNYVAGKH
jgi:hypothetical protein